MSLINFVEKSFLNFYQEDIPVSLSLACSAVDATSKMVFPNEKYSNTRFKKYVKKYFRIISYYGFPGIIASSIKIKCTVLKDIKTDENNMVGIEDIIYYTIRCGLTHKCETDPKLKFINGTKIGEKTGIFTMPKHIVIGLLMSVILCKKNEKMKLKNDIELKRNGETININAMWGKEEEFRK